MEPMSKTPKEAYVEGRLMGLNELISILKDSMETEGETHSDAITKSIVKHISSEMDMILDEVHGEHTRQEMAPIHEQHDDYQAHTKKVVKEVEKKSAEEAAPAVRKNVDAAEELMKNLMALREEKAASQ